MTVHHSLRLLAVGLAALFFSIWSHADQVRVAVAANFEAPMKRIASAFEQASGHQVQLTSGATGKFYAQIRNGAPFDIFLAADQITPARLETEGLALAGSRFTYASGKLLLWSAKPDLVDAQGAVLQRANFKHLALAAPKLAPYGAAAVQTLTRLGLLSRLEPKFVQGDSIGQTFGFIATGNAELGFIARSQVWQDGRIKTGSAWLVPTDLYDPIRQDAVQLRRAKDNAAASALMRFLKTEAAQSVIRSFGYDI